MKIIAIRGKNIASLEGEFEVDFTVEPLASANIFAIAGPTGSGKSSLLDTMCLALFARTPRTDQARELNVRLRDVNDDALAQSDPRFLLRRGTASGYAEADFIALNGHRYRSRWSVARAKEKESGRLQNPRLSLYNLDTETEEQGTRSELQQRIVDLIGLTFEQFTRSVLLAQNDFSTFLKAEQGEKAALLEKLTGTELYSRISKRIYEKNMEARADYDNLQSQIGGIALLNDEEETALKQQVKETAAILQKLELDKRTWSTLNEAVNNTATALKNKEEEQKETEVRLTRSILLCDQANATLKIALADLAKQELADKEMQPLLHQARQLDVELANAVPVLADSQKRLAETEKKSNDTQKKLEQISETLNNSESEKQTIEAWLKKHEEKEKIAGQSEILLLHLDAAERARSFIEKTKQEAHKVETETETNVAQKKTIDQLLVQKEDELKKRSAQCVELEKEIAQTDVTALEQQKEKLLHQREQLLQEQLLFSSVGNDIQELRAKLTENTPCPVCGSTDHPFASKEVHAKMQEIQNQIISLTREIAQVDKRLKETAEKRKLLDHLRASIISSNQEMAETGRQRNDLANAISLLNNRLQQLSTSKKEYQVELDRALSATNTLFGHARWQNAWLNDPLAFRRQLTDFVTEWQVKGKRKQELEQALSGLKSEQKSYTEFMTTVQKERQSAQEAHEKRNTAFQKLKEKRASLFNGKAAETVETECQSRMDAKKKEVEELQRTLTEQSDIASQIRGQKEQVTKDLTQLSATLVTARNSLETWLEKYHESSDGEMPDERWTKTLALKSEVDFRLQTQEASKKRVSGLREKADQKLAVSNQWAKLNELAGSADGAKFRKIAQTYTLDMLLGYANVQLRSFTNRYRLERVPDTLALQVIDSFSCDEIRTVHSLSGGESFLVSLALALGLSSLSSNRMKVESLFIDEGFGSLDAETLRAAMDALENLRTQGRKIGVISHVQEMTERIPVQIRVNRLGNGRSTIEIV